MNEKQFYQLDYQSQFYQLIDFTYQKYNHQPFLYYALRAITKTYEYSKPFSNKLLHDIGIVFDKE